jgi:hypothetical protein
VGKIGNVAGENTKRLARQRILDEYRDRLQRLLRDNPEDTAAELAIISEINSRVLSSTSAIDAQYAPDPPHATCRHAVITGVAVTNSTWIPHAPPRLPAPGDLVNFFRFGRESIHIWTHEADKPSLLVAEVDPDNARCGVWRTSAAALRLLNELTSMQEHRSETAYAWMYNFDRLRSFDSQEHLDEGDRGALNTRSHQTIDYWYDRAHVLELLARSKSFFVAAQLLCELSRALADCSA